MNKLRMITVFLSLGLPAIMSAAVIHVPGDQPTIQAGIDAAADGDTVLVADGTYRGDGNRDLQIHGKAITVKSAHGFENCIIHCDGSEDDPHRGFLFSGSHVGGDTVVQGFTIQNGYQDNGGGVSCVDAACPTLLENLIQSNTSYYRGGGIHCDEASPLIMNNTIVQNTVLSGGGGGIHCTHQSSPIVMNNRIAGNSVVFGGGAGIQCSFQSSPVIAHNTITGNTAEKSGGGGIRCWDEASPKIQNNVISGNRATGLYGGAGIQCGERASPTISFNTISGNIADRSGGGILCRLSSSPVIRQNIISHNESGRDGGGGIFSRGHSAPTIVNNLIHGNKAKVYAGGGIICNESSPLIMNNTIKENTAVHYGGGILCKVNSSPTIKNNLIYANHSEEYGGGVCCFFDASPTIENNTIAANSAQSEGGGLYCLDPSFPVIRNTIFRGNSPDEIFSEPQLQIIYSNVEGGYPGEGNINADPLFVTGPRGDYYLSHIAAGQALDSPCIDAGDPASDLIDGTTRTDAVIDSGIIDMGYHYPLSLQGLVAGPGPGFENPPAVRVFQAEQDGGYEYEFEAYGSEHYGVNLTCGDVNGGGFDEIITGPGPGPVSGPHVRGFRADGRAVPGLNFMAYGTPRFGVNVALGDIDGDGFDEIVTGAGPGAVFGPHVRAFNYDGEPPVTPIPGAGFMAYRTRHWGVNVGGGDLDGDGFDEIITGPGPGAVFGPHVRGWNLDGADAAPITGINFMAYETKKYGVVVSGGDLDGDGFDEIITAPGPSRFFGAHVRGWNYDGALILPLAGCSFLAWPSARVRYGARVFARADLDMDGRDDLIVGAGPDPAAGSPVKVFRYVGADIAAWFSLQAFPSSYTHGARVAAGRF